MRAKGIELLPPGRTAVMGILNLTPDSFSDGGRYLTPAAAVARAMQMADEGADFIDVGGQSTRPGAEPVSPEREWERLRESLPAICRSVACPVSVDTFYSAVAARALDAGAVVINDVSGRVDPDIARLIVRHRAAWVLTHNDTPDPENPVDSVRGKLHEMAAAAEALGVPAEAICLDPGIGFSKTTEQNLLLMRRTRDVKVPGYAYLLGASRKRCIGEPAGDPPPDARDPGTVAAHTVGILGGADIIRVHDVAGAVQAARVADAIKGGRDRC